MSSVSTVLDNLKAELQALYPSRIVTRSLKDFAERTPAELVFGVYTFVCTGVSGDIQDRTINALLVGQAKAMEAEEPVESENLELAMVDEIERFMTRSQDYIRADRILTSRQLEHPFAWVNAELRIGPYDFSGLDDIGDDFDTFRAEFDATMTSDTYRAATAVLTIDDDGAIDAVTVLDGGSGFTRPPEYRLFGPGTGALLQVLIDDGAVSEINVIEGGSGYTADTHIVLTYPPGGQIDLADELTLSEN